MSSRYSLWESMMLTAARLSHTFFIVFDWEWKCGRRESQREMRVMDRYLHWQGIKNKDDSTSAMHSILSHMFFCRSHFCRAHSHDDLKQFMATIIPHFHDIAKDNMYCLVDYSLAGLSPSQPCTNFHQLFLLQSVRKVPSLTGNINNKY